MSKRLEIQFLNQDGKTVTIALDNPIEPVNPVDVQEAIDALITNDIIETTGGSLVSLKEARVVTKTVTPIALT